MIKSIVLIKVPPLAGAVDDGVKIEFSRRTAGKAICEIAFQRLQLCLTQGLFFYPEAASPSRMTSLAEA